ncbi:hypothetical protein [Streptosporangium sp. 'caverna']|uniref:hypothetical protein n=1 Tax=Streptosporangium sp. 'caverna' TaxID=2202249 RepID=UPI0013A6FFD8|nr:hypothetical protein [Streptosporangium sp. 'caverna']
MEDWIYLATVIDCYTKSVVGWALSDNYKTPLIDKAIDMDPAPAPFGSGARVGVTGGKVEDRFGPVPYPLFGRWAAVTGETGVVLCSHVLLK